MKRCSVLCSLLATGVFFTPGCTDRNTIGSGDAGPDSAGSQDSRPVATLDSAAAPDSTALRDAAAVDASLPEPVDATVVPDAMVWPDLGPTATEKDYVVNTLTIPQNTTQAQQLGLDLDGNGTVDNKLGTILQAVAGLAQGFDLQKSVDAAIDRGNSIQLLRLRATDFVNQVGAQLEHFIGQPTQCCSAPADSALCASQAKASCYSGSYSFTPTSPTGTLMSGSISSASLGFGPAALQLNLPLSGLPVLVTLKGARLKGTLSGNTIADGVLGGAISQQDIDNSVLPEIALGLDSIVHDPSTSNSTKVQLLGLFDSDNDGNISAGEVSSSPLIKTILAPDVDVDGDGAKELSLGVGFAAVSAKIL